jgi:hypothetical protein
MKGASNTSADLWEAGGPVPPSPISWPYFDKVTVTSVFAVFERTCVYRLLA